MQVRSDDEETLRQLRQESAELNFMLGARFRARSMVPLRVPTEV